MPFVEELGTTLTDGQIRIWNRQGTPEFSAKDGVYVARWLAKAGKGEKPKPRLNLRDVGKSLPVICPHLGAPTGETIGCRACKASPPLEVYSCSLHGQTTLHRPGKADGLKCCKYCDDNPANVAAKDLAAEREAKRLAERRAAESREQVNEEYRRQADEFLANLAPYPEGTYSGRGITIAAGGKYWASAAVTVRMLRYHGCQLPIWIGYLGNSGERDERYEKYLAPYGVTFVDIDAHPARASRRGVKGFQTKLFLAVHSPFEEVLSLDPDNYPCANPEVLFDDERYKRLGAIYWPDGPQTDGWTNFGLVGAKKRGSCGLETGQYVLHKRLVWEPMMLAEWYDDRPEWTYGKVANGGGGYRDCLSGLDYADKGPPRAAFAKLERDYVVFNPTVNWYKIAFVQVGPDGKTPMFIHRSRSKFSAEGPLRFPTTNQDGENLRVGLPGEDTALGFLTELQAALRGVPGSTECPAAGG